MKKSLCFALVLVLGLLCLLCACDSSGSEKVYKIRNCSFSLPSSWIDNSSGDLLMYSAKDESAAVNVSFDDQAAKYRTTLKESLDGTDYELQSVTVAGEDVDLYVYQKDGFWFRDFELIRDDGAYHFTYLSTEQNPAHFESFTASLMFLS